MSLTPFPPQVVGNVYAIAPQIEVVNAVFGYTLVVAGSQSGKLAVYNNQQTAPGSLCVPLRVHPRVGEYIIVSQSRQTTNTTIDSGESQQSHVVVPIGNLPVPIINTIPHTCSDSIALSGLIPGATVVVELPEGHRVVEEVVQCKTAGNFHINYEGPLPASLTFTVWQEAIGDDGKPQRSGSIRSGPIPDLGYKNPLVTPTFVKPPVQCTNHLEIGEALPDALLGVLAQSDMFGVDVNLETKGTLIIDNMFREPMDLGKLTAFQSMPRCNLKSGEATADVVARTITKLPTPKRPLEICADLKKVLLTGLSPNGNNYLQVTRLVGAKSGQVKNAADKDRVRGPIPIYNETQYIEFPPAWDFTDSRGEVSFDFQVIGTGKCQASSDPTGPQYASTAAFQLSDPTIGPDPLYVCTDMIKAQNLAVGAEIQLVREDGMPVIEPMPVTSGSMNISLPHRVVQIPAKNGQFQGLLLTERGCGAGTKSRPLIPIPYDGKKLPGPEITIPLRPQDQKFSVKGLTLGTRVSVLVDKSAYHPKLGVRWFPEFTALESGMDITLVAPLEFKQSVSFEQKLCNDVIVTDGKVAVVDKAKLQVSFDPTELKKGTTPSVKITLTDPERGIVNSNLFGAISLDGFPSPFSAGQQVSAYIVDNYAGNGLKGSVSEGTISYPIDFSIPLKPADPPPDFIFRISGAHRSFQSLMPDFTADGLMAVVVTDIQFFVTATWVNGGAEQQVHNIQVTADYIHGEIKFPGLHKSEQDASHPKVGVRGVVTYSVPAIDRSGQLNLYDNSGGQQAVSPASGQGACEFWNLQWQWKMPFICESYPYCATFFSWLQYPQDNTAPVDNRFGIFTPSASAQNCALI